MLSKYLEELLGQSRLPGNGGALGHRRRRHVELLVGVIQAAGDQAGQRSHFEEGAPGLGLAVSTGSMQRGTARQCFPQGMLWIHSTLRITSCKCSAGTAGVGRGKSKSSLTLAQPNPSCA